MIWENPSNVYHYFLGNYRYKIYYSRYFKWLMRKHIRQQIAWRITVMDKECYNNGSCKICGCETIHLQCANKSCDKPCYPEMMSRYDWKYFKYGSFKDKHGLWFIDRITNKLLLVKETSYGHTISDN
jgi:hypothetical protein